MHHARPPHASLARGVATARRRPCRPACPSPCRAGRPSCPSPSPPSGRRRPWSCRRDRPTVSAAFSTQTLAGVRPPSPAIGPRLVHHVAGRAPSPCPRTAWSVALSVPPDRWLVARSVVRVGPPSSGAVLKRQTAGQGLGAGYRRRANSQVDGPVSKLCVSGAPATLPRMAKVTIIGAGSVEFTRNILADLCSYEELHGTLEIALHDIDAERLDDRPARGRADSSSAPAPAIAVGAYADRRAAFDGADYLINEIQVGGYRGHRHRLRRAEEVRTCARRSRTRSASAASSEASARSPSWWRWPTEMAELCPARPPAQLHEPDGDGALGDLGGVARCPPERTIGVCHSVRDTHAFLAETVGVPRGRHRVPHGRLQPPVLRLPVRGPAHRRGPLSAAPRDHRCGPGRARSSRARASCSSASATSPPSPPSTRPSTCPWFLHHDDQVERFRIGDRRVRAAQRREPRGVRRASRRGSTPARTSRSS